MIAALRSARALSLLCASLLLTSCVRLEYNVRWFLEPIADETLEELQPGVDDLGSVLRKLRAPQFVWEYDIDGAALGWVFEDTAGWGASVSYSFSEVTSASFAYDNLGQDLPGVVLWFDQDLTLLEWRRGNMTELINTARPRPQPVDQLFPEDGDGD